MIISWTIRTQPIKTTNERSSSNVISNEIFLKKFSSSFKRKYLARNLFLRAESFYATTARKSETKIIRGNGRVCVLRFVGSRVRGLVVVSYCFLNNRSLIGRGSGRQGLINIHDSLAKDIVR